jgi:oxygen-independent coproporphyrinogen III oxidase
VASLEPAEEFLTALGREIALVAVQRDAATFDTVFFGGGTPSLLAPRQFEHILAQLHRAFRILPGAEITLEANPGTVTRESLTAFRALGVNRLSVGVQSFHDHALAFLGRIHDGAEAIRCLTDARAAGFDNLAIDLIYAIPGQTLQEWDATLLTGTRCHPRHIAAYSLIVEEGTPLARSVRTGAVCPIPTELEAAMYERTMERLVAHGYDHYEVSNYAHPGFRCRHNSAYWSHDDYLGFGPSAHSFRMHGDGRSGARRWNVSDLSTYVDRLRGGLPPLAGEEHVGPGDLVREQILLGLRSDGVDLTRLCEHLGYDLESRQGGLIRSMIEENLAVLEGRVLRLTAQGFVLCDEICARLSRDVSPGPSPLPAAPTGSD